MKKILLIFLLFVSKTSLASEFCIAGHRTGPEGGGNWYEIHCADEEPVTVNIAFLFETRKDVAKAQVKMDQLMKTKGYTRVGAWPTGYFLFQKTEGVNPQLGLCIVEKTDVLSDGMRTSHFYYRIDCGKDSPVASIEGIDQGDTLVGINAYMSKMGYELKENLQSLYGIDRLSLRRDLIYQQKR